jgi:16S rRNA processing protein RimM
VIGVPRSELPPREDRDYYRADLIGCEVVNLAGVRLGAVAHFIEIPAHAVMVVRGEREYWVPAVPQHLRRVDLEARQVVVDWDDPTD